MQKTSTHLNKEYSFLPKTILMFPTSYFVFGGGLLLLLFLSDLLILSGLLVANIIVARLIRPFKKLKMGYAVEMISLSTVFAGVAYGVKAGIIFGAISMLANFIAMKRLSKFSLFVLPLYVLMGISAALLSSIPIIPLGIGLVIAYNIAINAIILTCFRGSTFKCTIFSATNIFWNFAIFSALAGPLLSLT